jgi:hypothetical protein
MWDGNVAQKSTGIGINDGQVSVVALEGGEEGERNGIGRVEREGGWRVEVFNSGLGSVSFCLSIGMRLIEVLELFSGIMSLSSSCRMVS